MASAVTSQNEQMVNVPSLPSNPVSVRVDLVAQDQPVLGQLVGDGEHGGPHPLVVGRQELQDRDQQEGRVELLVAVVLAEAAPRVDALVEDLGLQVVGRLAPLLGPVVVLADPGHVGAAVHGHPAQDLGGREVLGIAPDLPDALVGVARVRDGGLDQAWRGPPTPV